MSANGVDVSVLVPLLNEEPLIRECVESMRAQDFEGSIEFLFVDGRSSDGTRAVLEELAGADPRIVVLDNPQRHTAAALNRGLEHSSGRFVARMDAHARYPPLYLRVAMERLERGDADWVCGPQLPVGVSRWSRHVARALGTRLGVGASRRFGLPSIPEIELDTGVFTGMWRRETLLAFGGWDPDWPVNQDSELAARMLQRGRRIVSVRALGARYVPRQGLRALTRQYRRYGFYRAKTWSRHPSSARRSMLLPPGVALAIPAAVAPVRPLRVPARVALAAYGVVLTGTAMVTSRSPREVAGLLVVLPIMHLSWGAGFVAGAVWFTVRPPRTAPGVIAPEAPVPR